MQPKRFTLFVLAGLLLSSAVSARSIPGVTRPFDPGAYYSETAVSYRDSTYTPFTMKDLARNGYAVRDVMNNQKSIISDIKSYTEMLNQITAVLHALRNIASLGDDSSIENLKAYLDKIGEKPMPSVVLTESGFRDTEHFKRQEEKEKYRQMAAVYYEVLDRVKVRETKTPQKLLNEALASAARPDGFVAAQQAKTQIKAIDAALQVEKNALLSGYLSLAAAREKSFIDRDLAGWAKTKDGMAFQVADPHEKEQQENRKKGVGFIDF